MKKILVIEGQFNAPIFLQNQLIKPLLAKYPDKFKPTYIAWHQYVPYINRDFEIVIGHSLGGGAVIEMAKRDKFPVYITVDPRHMTNAGLFDWFIPFLGDFQVPKLARLHNFYQRGFMSGYPVQGAVSNTKVWSTHFTIPSHPAIVQFLESIL